VTVAAKEVVEYWQMVWSAPAFGLGTTVTYSVSVQGLTDHIKPYRPAELKPEIEVVSAVVLAIMAAAGLLARGIHVP
jgi:hypothetical protein